MIVTTGGQSIIDFKANINGEDIRLLKMKFDLMIDHLTDLSPVWAVLSEQMQKDIKKVFQTEGKSMGEKWVGLAKSTQKQRKREGYPPEHPILQRSGKLMNSLLGGGGSINDWRENWWEYGTEVRYAIYHQSRKPRTKLPRRAFLYVSKKFKGMFVQLIHRYVMTGKI